MWTARVLLAGGVLSYGPHAYNCPAVLLAGEVREGRRSVPPPAAPVLLAGVRGEGAPGCSVAGWGRGLFRAFGRSGSLVDEGGRTLWPGPLHHLSRMCGVVAIPLGLMMNRG